MKNKRISAFFIAAIIMLGTLSLPALGAVERETAIVTPTAYSSREQYITTPKNQGDFGLCWAFSAVACAEADAIKNHGADRDTLDLSEWHLAYFSYHGVRAETGDSVSISGNIPYYEVGGFDMLSSFTLSAGIGFADEATAPYSVLSANPRATLGMDKMYDSVYKINNIYFYDIKTQPEKIKEAIMEYGAVSASYLGSENYYNASNYTQYCETADDADHAITVVGWDDDFSRSSFRQGAFDFTIPKSNGAWLVKNSWGDTWGDGGYFWISYEDATLSGGTVFDVIPADTYDRLYLHDGGGAPLSFPCSQSTAVANAFVTKGEYERLSAIGVGISTDELFAQYKLEIYIEPPSLDNAFLGDPVYTQSGVLINGYNTLTLNAPIDLEGGEQFVVSLSTDANIMVDQAMSVKLGDNAYHNSHTSVRNNETFYRYESGKWTDVGDQSKPWNARIKAYTVEIDKELPYLDTLPSLSSLSYGQLLSDASIVGGSVKSSADGIELSGTWSFRFPHSTPKDGDEIDIIFTPDDSEKYGKVRGKVKISVATEPWDISPPETEASAEDDDFSVSDVGGSDKPDDKQKNTSLFLILAGIVGIPTTVIIAIIFTVIVIAALIAALIAAISLTAVIISTVNTKKRKKMIEDGGDEDYIDNDD